MTQEILQMFVAPKLPFAFGQFGGSFQESPQVDFCVGRDDDGERFPELFRAEGQDALSQQLTASAEVCMAHAFELLQQAVVVFFVQELL